MKKTLTNEHGQPINRKFSAKRLTERSIDEIIGICKGFISDGILSEKEIDFLCAWLKKNQSVIDLWPFNILKNRIIAMLQDGIIDGYEQKELFSILSDITGSKSAEIDNISHLTTTLPLTNPAPEIEFKYKTFCFTGEFIYGSRDRCIAEVESRGASTVRYPTQKTNYVIIGLYGSTDWIHSTHGRKIEQALELQKKSIPILIVSEKHWASFL